MGSGKAEAPFMLATAPQNGHATDALFAMAVHEAKENAVSQIQDGAFQNVKNCECFQTGELWNWVWTRDIAYATELGLAWLDTERAKNSLLIKTSARKSGGGSEIIQDSILRVDGGPF